MKNHLVHSILSAAITLALLACGSSSSGPATGGSAAGSATGTVGGVALDVQDAIFANGVTTGTVLGIVSFSGACETLYASNRFPKSSAALSFQLVSFADGGVAGPVTTPGTFRLIGAGLATDEVGAQWDAVDASCGPTTTSATGGAVTVTGVTSSELTGTFDLMFGADHLTGSFRAAVCAAAADAQGDPTCS